jgi:hypothetical protein
MPVINSSIFSSALHTRGFFFHLSIQFHTMQLVKIVEGFFYIPSEHVDGYVMAENHDARCAHPMYYFSQSTGKCLTAEDILKSHTHGKGDFLGFVNGLMHLHHSVNKSLQASIMVKQLVCVEMELGRTDTDIISGELAKCANVFRYQATQYQNALRARIGQVENVHEKLHAAIAHLKGEQKDIATKVLFAFFLGDFYAHRSPTADAALQKRIVALLPHWKQALAQPAEQ